MKRGYTYRSHYEHIGQHSLVYFWWVIQRYALAAGGADLVHYFKEAGLGAIVNSSRGIIAAYKQEKYAKFGAENYAEASRQAVLDMQADIQGALEAVK